MAERDGAAVWVDARVAGVDAPVFQGRQNLRGEGFVNLDDIKIIQRETAALQ